MRNEGRQLLRRNKAINRMSCRIEIAALAVIDSENRMKTSNDQSNRALLINVMCLANID